MNEIAPKTMLEDQEQDVVINAEAMMEEIADAEEAETGVVCLPEELGIAQVEACCAQLAEALAGGLVVKIDAAALKQVDTAGVQLLYAFVQEAGKKGMAVIWVAKSEELLTVSGQLGLAEGMGL